MKTFLANAFAVGRPAAVQEFHLSRSDTDAPSVPLNHYFDPKTNRKNRSPIPLFHAEAYKRNACLEHFDLFKVNSSATDAAD